MSQLSPYGTDDEVQCSECNAVFTIIYRNDGFSKVEFCPFCGDEVEPLTKGTLSESILYEEDDIAW